MPHPILFMAAAGAGATSTNSTAAFTLTCITSLITFTGGYALASKSSKQNEDRQKAAREAAQRARYERDRQIRETASRTAQFISNETTEIIRDIQSRQRKFTELMTELNSVLAEASQGNEHLQEVIQQISIQSDELIAITQKYELELPNLQQKLMVVTAELSEVNTTLAHDESELRQAVHNIGEISQRLKTTPGLIQTNNSEASTPNLTGLVKQNTRYKELIEKLMGQAEEQTKVIKTLETELARKQKKHTPHRHSGAGIFKNNFSKYSASTDKPKITRHFAPSMAKKTGINS